MKKVISYYFVLLIIISCCACAHNMNYRSIMVNPDKYKLASKPFSNSISYTFTLPLSCNINDIILFEDSESQIVLTEILETDGQYELFIEYRSKPTNNRLTLLSPFSFDITQKTDVYTGDVNLQYNFKTETNSRRLHWHSYQIIDSGIRTSYLLLYTSEEMNYIQNENCIQFTLLLNNLTTQRWINNN